MSIKLEPCRDCKNLKRIPVGYVSIRYECRLDRKLRIRDDKNVAHPLCPLRKNLNMKASNLRNDLKCKRCKNGECKSSKDKLVCQRNGLYTNFK